MKFHYVLNIAALMLIFVSQFASSHCQVPCGIYDDHARYKAMLEDAMTVEKATNLMAQLKGNDAQSRNQFVRWVMNKEKHAQNVIATISDYFLTQRVKSSQKDYDERLRRHHAVIVAAMKAKQNADIKYARELYSAIQGLATYYPSHDKDHKK
ncbi:MAG: superoxide dismutase, Ni [Cellvibrionaceae bacterium]|nr:superoxide dismutase, Ni [Cellvibrionaceae bacterium]